MDAAIDDQIDSIWVAEGTYLPTEASDGFAGDSRDRAFHLADRILNDLFAAKDHHITATN